MANYLKILAVYVVMVNGLGLVIMGWDKGLAKLNWRRIPEKRLFLLAYLGGALGIFSGMKLFRHKTQHKSFVYGIPVLVVINLAIYGLIIFQLKNRWTF